MLPEKIKKNSLKWNKRKATISMALRLKVRCAGCSKKRPPGLF